MKITTFFSLIILTLVSLIFVLAWILSMKTFMDREKNSPYECGFDPKTFARIPFSLLYFLIIIIFLIFDVEITLLIPITYTFMISNLMNMMLLIFLFIMILLYGLYYEWYQNALTWIK